MAEYFTWTKLFQAGGVTLIILIACSVVSFIVIIERLIYFVSRTADGARLLEERAEDIRAGKFSDAGESLADTRTPVGYVLGQCLQLRQDVGSAQAMDDSLFEEVKSRAIAEKIPEMERYVSIEATLGTVAPFIGLLGTVLGIIRAFQSIGKGAGQAAGNVANAAANAGLSGLNAGIAEALIATAAGLFVAIPATIAYNYFRRRISSMTLEMEVAASRLKVLLKTAGS